MTAIDAGGVQLEYQLLGQTDHPVIVLVRGLGTQMIDWPDELLQGLQDNGFAVLIFDNRDVGLSQKFVDAPDYSLDDMALDITNLLDALKIDRAHVLGISLGGMIVQQMAVRHADRMLSLISVMSSSGRKGLPGPTEEAARALAAETAAGTSRESLIEALVEGWAVYGSPAYPIPVEERRATIQRRFDRDSDADGVRRQMAAIRATGPRDELLKSIRLPTLVIHGADDPLVRLEAGVDTAELIIGARLEVIQGMGHDLPPALMPELVEMISQFCHEAAA